MGEISREMDALLTYAENAGLCLWQYDEKDGNDLSNWEYCLWEPSELRQALHDFPEQPRAGIVYPPYSYDFDIREFHRWRIVNPQDIYPKLEQEAHDAEKQAHAAKEAAARFRRLWIEKTDKPWRKTKRLFGLK